MQIYINGVPWSIEVFSEEEILHEDAIARCYPSSYTIRYNPNLSGVNLIDTLCHEVIHAIYRNSHMGQIELNEEHIASFIGTGIASILIDSRNNNVLEFLKESIMKTRVTNAESITGA